MFTAKDLMNEPITAIKDSNVSEIIKKLLYHNISRIIVKDLGRPVGIISEKDLGFFLFNDKTSRSLENIPVDEVMKNLVFVHKDNPVNQCARIMLEKKTGSLVVGSEEKLEGILTKTDIIQYFAKSHVGENKVVDIKNPGYVSIPTEASLSQVIQNMLENEISRIIVVNQKREPVGIISFRDFFRISLQLGSEEDVTETFALSGQLRSGFLSENGFGGVSLARDVMSQNIIAVDADDDLAMVCKVMLDNHVNGVFVKEKEDRTGIVSKTDVVQLLALKK